MFNWHFLSILNGLDVIWLLFGWDFPNGGTKFCGFGPKWPPKRQMRNKHLLGGHFLTPNCVFWAIVREIISMRLKTGRKAMKAGRKKSPEVYISRICRATPSGRIPTKLGNGVCLTDIIKRVKFHRYNLRGFGAVRCWRFHVAIRPYGTHAFLTTLLCAIPQVIKKESKLIFHVNNPLFLRHHACRNEWVSNSHHVRCGWRRRLYVWTAKKCLLKAVRRRPTGPASR